MSGSDPIIGMKLGDYIIVDILGQGGMARVYRGMDKKLNRYSAVKVIDAQLIREDQEEYRQRFQNEARAIARLAHSNIVGIYQFDQVGTIYYMAMSFIDGKDLRAMLKDHVRLGTRMSYAEILRVIKDIAGALDYAHSEGVIHRDIKPSNIMVTSSGKAILTDFGLALSVPDGTIGNTFGSAHYIAPEQAISSAQAVPQSDIYSLGIVLFEMLTNRVPFNDPSAMAVAMKHLNDPPPPPSRVNPNISPKIDQVVLRALDKNPKNRFVNCMAMAQALEAAFAQADPTEESASRPQPLPLPSWGDDPVSPSQTGSAVRKDSTEGRLLQSWGGEERTVLPKPMDDVPTITDSKLSTAARAQFLQQRKPPQRRWGLIGGAAFAAIIVLFLVLALTLGQNNATEQGITPSAENTVAATQLATQVAVIPPTGTEVVTEEATPEAVVPTSTEQLVSATSTDVVEETTTELAPTEPAATSTSVVTPEATAVVSGATDSVTLLYDEESLTLINQTGSAIDVSALKFVQTKTDGSTLEYNASVWGEDGNSRWLTALPDDDCFQVSRNDLPTASKPASCDKRQGWRRVSFPRWFWRSEDAGATFDVMRGTTVLATCTINTGECTVEID